jgi:hypothetical protein
MLSRVQGTKKIKIKEKKERKSVNQKKGGKAK